MKKLLLGLGTMTAIAVPVVAVVSCGDNGYKKVIKQITIKDNAIIKQSLIKEAYNIDIDLNDNDVDHIVESLLKYLGRDNSPSHDLIVKTKQGEIMGVFMKNQFERDSSVFLSEPYNAYNAVGNLRVEVEKVIEHFWGIEKKDLIINSLRKKQLDLEKLHYYSHILDEYNVGQSKWEEEFELDTSLTTWTKWTHGYGYTPAFLKITASSINDDFLNKYDYNSKLGSFSVNEINMYRFNKDAGMFEFVVDVDESTQLVRQYDISNGKIKTLSHWKRGSNA